MASPSTRMRLTIEVLPLAAENAHGPYRAHAMAAFKGRKFALPVRSEDTFELVWAQIEQRYKTNYLNAQQAANFTIKKLQDAYDCDLDLGDTVNDIFEGESDATMRVVKVVPTFVNRDFSVPPTSNLRPAHERKRMRESSGGSADKRRRLEQTRDSPIPSTELEPVRGHVGVQDAAVKGSRAGSRATRSRTQASLVFMKDVQTGQDEFRPMVKEESPELGLPPPPRTARKSPSQIPRPPAHVTSPPHHTAPTSPTNAPRSPAHVTPLPAASKRRDIYDLPSSQEDGAEPVSSAKPHKPSARTPSTVQKEVDLLNSTRQRATQSTDLTTVFLNNTELYSKPVLAKTPNSKLPAAVPPTTSPFAPHRPARFLSHSPTVEKEVTVEEEDEQQQEASEDDNDNSSESDTEEEDEEEEEEAQILDDTIDETVEVPATAVDGDEQANSPEPTADELPSASKEHSVIDLPSSPPRPNGAPASTPRIPESSQLTPSQLNPPIRHTPIPLPSNIRRMPQSSQATATRTPVQRPSARYTGFRTIKEQLADAETTPSTNGRSSYDPRTLDLTKLVAKRSGKPVNGITLGVGGEEGSEDESSSSSSDSDSD